ncbi:MAG TPA: hypothetical protein VFL91_11020, partial [Thermomicrobiales bacterium]|nr:hypothetical protein [Thermomicrobiales bacterium]
MTAPPPAPPSARAELAGPDTWASIAYDVDGPSFEFVRPPFNFNIPLTDDELRGMAAGVFPEQVEAALASAALPPATPLTEADWEAFRRIAQAALDMPSPVVPLHPEGPGTRPQPAVPAGHDPAVPPPLAGDVPPDGVADAAGTPPPAERVEPPGTPSPGPGEADR